MRSRGFSVAVVVAVLACLLPARLHAADALPFHGWTLTQDDTDYNLSVIGQVQAQGVTHVQLSHRIVSRVDQLQNEPEVVGRVRTLADAIHAQGAQAIVWMQELNTSGTLSYCFDPDGADLQAKMQAYREALAAVPQIDGVMLSFGSAPTELALILPSCQPLQFAAIKEKYKAMIEAVARVVMDEFGKQVYVRTFYHKGLEIPYLRAAIAETERPIVVMTKSEPNDFEPYYPLNELVGDVGAHPQLLELDCAGEYWGRGAIPFVAVEYFAQRFRESRARHAGAQGTLIGSSCRVDRYERSAIGTLNEANLHAQAELLADADTPWQTILSRFVTARFGLAPASTAHQTLFDILRRTYWVGRKMYYAKGEWAFEKGSGLPDSATDALTLMLDKTISQWDAAYVPVTAGLIAPSLQNLRELLQEKHEAIQIAQRNLDALPALRELLDAESYGLLDRLLTKQRVATEIWFHMAGAVFGGRNLSLQSSGWVSWHLDEMERIAAALDSGAWPQIVDPYPFSSEDIRAFVANERGLLQAAASEPDWLRIEGVDVLDTGQNHARVVWTAVPGLRYTVELSERLPDYPLSYPVEDGAGGSLDITGLQPQTPYWFRIRAEADDQTMVSGDYTFWTRAPGEDQPPAPGEPPEPTDPLEPGASGASGGSGGGAFAELWPLLAMLLLAAALRHFRR